MPLVAMLILSMVMVSVRSDYPPFPGTTTVWVADDYLFYSEDTSLVSNTFNVSVNIWNVSDMGVFEFKLSYNTTLLSAQYVYIDPPLYAEPTPGWDWLPEDTIGVWHPDAPPTINNTAGAGGPGLGRVWIGCTIPTPGAGTGLYGNITLVTIRFHIDYAPPRPSPPPPTANLTVSCDLHLYDVVVGDWEGVAIASSTSDGYYEYTRGQIVPGEPKADFSVNPPFPFVCDDVTVTSTSTPNGGAINSWDWSLTGPGSWLGTSPNGNPTRIFHCDGPGSVFVTLNVTDTEGMWDDVTKEIIQTEVIGPIIDLFTKPDRQYPEGTVTPHDGKGLGADCDSYAPGENVTLYANVTYNGDIVQNILVGFEVLDPLDRCVTYRVARTNDVGIATTWFRIPIPCSPDEQLELFGHWWVIAKCKLQDEIINDTMSFKVGWIVEIIGLETLPFTEWYKCEWVVMNVTLKNIAWIPRNVTVIVVIYDDCDVPIGQVVIPDLEIPAAPAELCSEKVISVFPELHIPKWAYIGAGKVYANAFTALPQDCGIPYCPEVMFPILISIGEPRI